MAYQFIEEKYIDEISFYDRRSHWMSPNYLIETITGKELLIRDTHSLRRYKLRFIRVDNTVLPKLVLESINAKFYQCTEAYVEKLKFQYSLPSIIARMNYVSDNI